ncbi:MAG: hypothetical protein ACK5MD_07590 [Flavobacteriales bacterium]
MNALYNINPIKKSVLTFAVLMQSILAFGQVGVNTQAPKATLDVVAKKTDGTTAEGVIAPRLTGDQIKAADAQYGVAQEGTLVYATVAVNNATTKTVNITKEGYYYFDGSVWIRLESTSRTAFIPYVVASGKQSTTITQTDGTGFKKWDFIPILSDGYWTTADNSYTAPRNGYYQFSLRGVMRPNKDTNYFSWVLKKVTGTDIEYLFAKTQNVKVGPAIKPYTYNRGGITVLYLRAQEKIVFGSIANGTASTTHTITNRSFTVTFLGES